jgi:hypothetical protein
MDVCLLWVLCVCQVDVSATGWSLGKRSPTDCGCVIVCDLETSRMRRLKPASGLWEPIKEEEEVNKQQRNTHRNDIIKNHTKTATIILLLLLKKKLLRHYLFLNIVMILLHLVQFIVTGFSSTGPVAKWILDCNDRQIHRCRTITWIRKKNQ